MVALLPGENLVKAGPAQLNGPQGGRSGTLSLTDQAIVFEGPPGGPGPGMRPGGGRPFGGRPGWGARPGAGPRGPGAGPPGVLRIPLWRCRNATVVGGPQGPGVQLELLFRQLFLSISEPDAWVAAINQARAKAPPPPPGAMGPGGPGLGRGAMPRCEYCGQLSSATATHCESCGAPF